MAGGVLVSINCDHCGTSFEKRLAAYNHLKAKGRKFYCTRSCASLDRYKFKSCPACGTEFRSKRASHIYCSVPCTTAKVDPESGKRRCSRCEEVKELASFAKNARLKDGLSSVCKPCKATQSVEYRERTGYKPVLTREQVFAANLKRLYGITPKDYDGMLEKQGGLCAVCLLPEVCIDPKTGVAKKLAVHHNHRTGKVIALCCSECNMGMGKLKDDPVLLRRAAELNEVS